MTRNPVAQNTQPDPFIPLPILVFTPRRTTVQSALILPDFLAHVRACPSRTAPSNSGTAF